MKPVITIDSGGFHAALTQTIARSKRDIAEVLNMRAAAVLMRTFLLLEPRDPQAKRNEVRAELNTEIGERTRVIQSGRNAGMRKRLGRSRQFQAKHRILQWLRAKSGKPGLYGAEMRKEAGRFSRGRVASVGTVKALIVKMLRGVMPGFTQFGAVTAKSKGHQVKGNAMLIKLAGQYNHAASNVGAARNSTSTADRAKPGLNPVVQVGGWLDVDNGQESRVDARYTQAATRAFADERVEMLNHISGAVLDAASQSGFNVK